MHDILLAYHSDAARVCKLAERLTCGDLSCHALQGVGKWFEGAQGQSVYWAVSNDTGLTWGPTQVMIPSPDTLPLWGPVMYTAVQPPTPVLHPSCAESSGLVHLS